MGPFFAPNSTNNCDVVPSLNLHNVHFPQKSPTVQGAFEPKPIKNELQLLLIFEDKTEGQTKITFGAQKNVYFPNIMTFELIVIVLLTN